MPVKIILDGDKQLMKAGALAKEARMRLFEALFDASKVFGYDAVRFAKNKYLSGPRPSKIKSEGLLKTRINTETVKSGDHIDTSVGSDVLYAAIHEFGGTTHPNVTDRMRKFAWAKFYETKDDKFKFMALTKKSKLTIKIPERPYINPAMDDAMPKFKDNVMNALRKVSFVGAGDGE